MHERAFMDSINADPIDRTPQLVFADWLDEQGDPRGEAWRVLVQVGKFPARWAVTWRWSQDFSRMDHALPSALFARLQRKPDLWLRMTSYSNFFSAFNDAAVAYVRYYHDSLFGLSPQQRGLWTLFGFETEKILAERRAQQNEFEMIPEDPVPSMSRGPHAP